MPAVMHVVGRTVTTKLCWYGCIFAKPLELL